MAENPYHLPRTVLPRRYQLRLEPDLDAAEFIGREVVEVDVIEPVRELVLNASELEIETASLITSDGVRLDAEVSLDETLGRALLTLPAQVKPGTARLHLEFRGILNDRLRGFYLSSFKDPEGNLRHIATTQFESSDARRAFPCWDEPDLKAVFSVTLVVPDGLMAVSNTREIGTTPGPEGKKVVTFADTIPMSTYLVAFIVGPFEATDGVDVDGVPLRVIFPIGKGHLTAYALELGAFCLRYFTDYYGIAYPGDKVDFLAIPDFAFGAMENLGAITYRESLVLVDPDRVGQHELRVIADVIAHELAHMWFGDLVTMRWWNGIWLNEAFASFMEMKAVEAYRPDWKRWLSFATKQGLFRSSERFDALESDALEATRPVEYEVISPSDADGMFDALTYGKGSAVLRMLEQYLGEDVFRNGIRRYLDTHRFGNTETSDLWAALEAVAGVPVGEIMDTWILQPGFPVVELEPSEDAALRARQRRYTCTGTWLPQTWQVPLVVRTFRAGIVAEHRMLLTEPAEVAPADADFVFLNGGGHGFFRSAHPPDMLKRMGANLGLLSDLEQLVLIDDARSLVTAGTLKAADFLRLCLAYRDCPELAIWQVLLAGLEDLFPILEGGDQELLEGFVRSLVGPAFARLGWSVDPDEPDLQRKLRGTLLMALGRIGNDSETAERCREHLERATTDPRSVDPDVAYAAAFVAAAFGDEHLFERYVNLHHTADTPQDRNRYLYALAEFPVPTLARRLAELTLTGEIKSQDGPYVVSRLLYNRRLGGEGWRIVRHHWEKMMAAYPPVIFNHVLDYLYALSDPVLSAEAAAFLEGRTFPLSHQYLPRRLEELRIHQELRTRESSRLIRFLRTHQ